MAEPARGAVAEAEKYYDSDDADRFYFEIWGGEDIHIGLYDEHGPSIREASHRTLEKMAEVVGELPSSARVLDIGAGYGGAARFLAGRFGCHVTCLNLSEVQNRRNQELTAKAGLSDRVAVVHGNFEELPFDAESFDLVWAQDAILHSGNRPRVLEEVARVLSAKGRFVFTDPMQSDDCPPGVLQPVLDRIHLESLGSIAFYRTQLKKLGFEEDAVVVLTEQLGRHYSRVHDELSKRQASLSGISTGYVDRMLAGLQNWVAAERAGHLAWGILSFRKG